MSLVTSDTCFALGAEAGDVTLGLSSPGVLVNTTITIGGGRIYFLESHSPQALENDLGRMPMSTFLAGPNFLVALDLQSGQTLWKTTAEPGELPAYRVRQLRAGEVDRQRQPLR